MMDNQNNEMNTNNLNNEGMQDQSGSPEGSYGYSYINQDQKNPNNVWRAEENTSSNYQSSSYQGGSQADQAGSGYQSGWQTDQAGTAYQSRSQTDSSYQSGQAGATGNTYQSGSQENAYSHIYGQNAGRGWSTYTEARKRRKEEKAARRAQRQSGGGSPAGAFGMKLVKAASIALVFGLVAGTAFEGSSYLLGTALGDDRQIEAAREEEEAASRKSVLTTTDGGSTATNVSSTGATDVSAIASKCMPSIVAITNMSEETYQNWFGQVQNYESESAGSGIIISEDKDYLYIATNNHVVEGAKTLTVQFSDDSTASASVKGTDKSSDLAVVQVKKSDVDQSAMKTIKIATFGDSDNLQVGSQAIAIGNALGYGQSVTTGIISALNREVTIQDEQTGESFTNDLIQTDAAINPGNSGGALLNSKGEVIGINSSKYSDTKVEGMGFAIPANTAKPIIEDLITREEVSQDKAAYLGISGVDVTDATAETYNMPEGVYIAQVGQGTAAEKAGLAKGDIITGFDGKKVRSMEGLQSTLKYYEAGSQVKVTIQRMGNGAYEEKTITVTLGKKN